MSIPPKILVVEDDLLVSQSFIRMIEEEEYEVHSACNCTEGLEILDRMKFDLVLTDIRLGDGTGVSILERAKKIDPAVIVFLITGYSSLDSMKLALRKGAADYIVKPVDMDLLLLKIRSVLEHRSQPSDLLDSIEPPATIN